MALRSGTTLGALLLVFAFSQIATAQENLKLAAPQNGIQPAAAEGASKADIAWSEVLRELQLLRVEVQTLHSNVSGLQQNMNAVQDGFAKQMEINEKLERQAMVINERAQSLVDTRINSLVQGGSESNFVRSIQADPLLAGDFRKVVQGKVIFDNQTGEAQRIFVNGTEWEVITGRSSMMVPYGQVTFHTNASNDGRLTQFNVDNWSQQGDLFVLNVPLQEMPTAAR